MSSYPYPSRSPHLTSPYPPPPGPDWSHPAPAAEGPTVLPPIRALQFSSSSSSSSVPPARWEDEPQYSGLPGPLVKQEPLPLPHHHHHRPPSAASSHGHQTPTALSFPFPPPPSSPAIASPLHRHSYDLPQYLPQQQYVRNEFAYPSLAPRTLEQAVIPQQQRTQSLPYDQSPSSSAGLVAPGDWGAPQASTSRWGGGGEYSQRPQQQTQGHRYSTPTTLTNSFYQPNNTQPFRPFSYAYPPPPLPLPSPSFPTPPSLPSTYPSPAQPAQPLPHRPTPAAYYDPPAAAVEVPAHGPWLGRGGPNPALGVIHPPQGQQQGREASGLDAILEAAGLEGQEAEGGWGSGGAGSGGSAAGGGVGGGGGKGLDVREDVNRLTMFTQEIISLAQKPFTHSTHTSTHMTELSRQILLHLSSIASRAGHYDLAASCTVPLLSRPYLLPAPAPRTAGKTTRAHAYSSGEKHPPPGSILQVQTREEAEMDMKAIRDRRDALLARSAAASAAARKTEEDALRRVRRKRERERERIREEGGGAGAGGGGEEEEEEEGSEEDEEEDGEGEGEMEDQDPNQPHSFNSSGSRRPGEPGSDPSDPTNPAKWVSTKSPSSRKKRKIEANPPKCHSCAVTETPEWRKGPDGPRTLCNSCGLHWMKFSKNAFMVRIGVGIGGLGRAT